MGTAETNKKISKNNKKPHKDENLICCWVFSVVGVLVAIGGIFMMIGLPIVLGNMLSIFAAFVPAIAIYCFDCCLVAIAFEYYEEFTDKKTQRKNDEETATQNSNGGKIANPTITNSIMAEERPEKNNQYLQLTTPTPTASDNNNSKLRAHSIKDMTDPIKGNYAVSSFYTSPSRPGGSPSNG